MARLLYATLALFARCIDLMNKPDPTLPDTSWTAYSRRQVLAGVTGAAALSLAKPAASAGEMPLSSTELWTWARAQQVINPKLAYLDTATIGPNLRVALAVGYRAEEAFSTDVGAYLNTRLSAAVVRGLAERAAGWMDCAADEICFTTGATEALNIVANGLDLAPGDEVLTTTHEHPAALAPWLLQAKRRGIVIKQVPLPSPLTGPEQALGLLAGAVTERTRVLAFCHVQSTDGAVLPVRELCAFARQRNILSVVDGALAFGAFKFSLRELDCDFYAASLHKWLNGPYGSGVLYVRGEQLERLWPLSTRAAEDSNFMADWPRTLRKFGTSFPYFGPRYQALEAALNLQEQIGRERIEARIRELAIYAKLRLQQLPAVELLTPSHPAMWSAVMSFRLPNVDAVDLAARLTREDNVVVQALTRPSTGFTALRVSLHIYNSHDDIERLLLGIRRRLRS